MNDERFRRDPNGRPGQVWISPGSIVAALVFVGFVAGVIVGRVMP